MVKVQIVEEKDQDSGENNEVYSSRGSSASASVESFASSADEEETFYERIAALADIVPPTTRYKISSRLASTASFVKAGGKLVGNLVWIVTTSALLVGLPLALSLEDEAKLEAQEKEMLAQQQGAQQVRGRGPVPQPQHAHAQRARMEPSPLICCSSSRTFSNFLTDTFPYCQMMAPSMYPSPPGSNPNQAQPKGIVPPGF